MEHRHIEVKGPDDPGKTKQLVTFIQFAVTMIGTVIVCAGFIFGMKADISQVKINDNKQDVRLEKFETSSQSNQGEVLKEIRDLKDNINNLRLELKDKADRK